jgi:aminomethyltransferase
MYAHLLSILLCSGKEKDVKVTYINDRALLAIQGPTAAAVVQKLVPAGVDLSKIKFMTGAELTVAGIQGCWVQRSGYTGEDGFEISVPAGQPAKLAEAMLANSDVKLCGLGARDSLRLEAGLCLYGHDINDTTTPKSANLVWAVPKARRERGGFLGDSVILNEINKGVETASRRIGLAIEGAPARGTQRDLSPYFCCIFLGSDMLTS